MNAEAILAVSASVVALVQLVKWAGLSTKYAPVAVLVCSLMGVLFWGWSTNTMTRATAFEVFAGLIAVMTSAAGVFGFVRESREAMTAMRKDNAA